MNFKGYFFKNSFLTKHNSSFETRKSLFFLLTPSPWPLFGAFSAFFMLASLAAYFNFFENALHCFFLGLILVSLTFIFWCKDLVREATFLGRFSSLLEKNSYWGFGLFILSEALLFMSFFWAFFHASLEAGIELGTYWPPIEALAMDDLFIPIANTVFLLASGAALTWAQYGLIAGRLKEFTWGMHFVFAYAFWFMTSQWTEYLFASHYINDGAFGSTMYLITAFHGMHVLIGSIFLFVCYIKIYLGHYTPLDYVTLTLAAWYWHFVDIVWIAVFSWVYIWGTWVSDKPEIDFLKNFFQLSTS